MNPPKDAPLPWKVCETYLGRIVAANGLYFDLDTTDDQLVAYVVAAANALPRYSRLADECRTLLGTIYGGKSWSDGIRNLKAALAALPEGVRT